MASKAKKRSKRLSGADLFDQVRRNLEKGQYKRALKDVKICYRQSPTEEHRRFLECAYMGRAQELMRQGLRDECRRTVENLLELGVTEPSVEAALPGLLVATGMFDRLPKDHAKSTDTDSSDLEIKLADHAVLRPQEVPGSMAEIRSRALQVRAAIEAVGGGDESQALLELKDIARNSPFAEWRFFVRGLAAYYRQDGSALQANWDRLDSRRMAFRIAAPLKAMAGALPPGAHKDEGTRSALNKLERQLTSRSLLSQLDVIRRHARRHDWNRALQMLRDAHGVLRRVDLALYHRLGEWFALEFIHEGLTDELERLTRIIDPLPLDPRWNRARAMLFEIADHTNFDDALPYWRKYLADLETLPALSTDERNVARALVFRHMARSFAGKAGSLRRCLCGANHEPEITEAQDQLIANYEQCLRLAPTFAPAYEELAKAFDAAGQPERAAETHQRALEHLPDQLDSLIFLAHHCLRRDEPVSALEYARRARGQKPLDKAMTRLVWNAHVALARYHARNGQFDSARAQFAAADALDPQRGDTYDVLARKACVEFKSGAVEAGRQLVEDAQRRLSEPAPLWLMLAIESIRYELPKEDAWLYEKRWTDALRRRCRSETAGKMCELMTAHLTFQKEKEYDGRTGHVRRVLEYVRRCSRVRWHQDDLRSVGGFLYKLDETELLKKYMQKGRRKFPQVAFFHWMCGEIEADRGPLKCDRELARECFERVLELAAESNDPGDAELVETAKRRLTMLTHVVPSYFAYDDDDDDDNDEDDGRFDFIGGGIGASMRDLYNMFRKMCDDLGVDPEDVLRDPDAAEQFARRMRGRRSRRTRRGG